MTQFTYNISVPSGCTDASISHMFFNNDHENRGPDPTIGRAADVSAINPPAATSQPPGYVRCGPGEAIANPRPGDIILVRGVGWLGRGIRGYQRIFARGAAERTLAHWSHAAIVVSSRGLLVEVLHNGVVLVPIEKYRAQEYHYVPVALSGADRANVSRYAISCVRLKYGRWSFVLLMISKLLGGRFRVPDLGQQGCVSLIVRALQQVGVPFERGPADMSVVDLAKRFGVRP